jgi:hypothetical protein
MSSNLPINEILDEKVKIIHPKDNPTLNVTGLYNEYNIAEPYYMIKFKEITDEWTKGWYGYNHAIKCGLVPNESYKLIKIDVGKSSTYYTIEGIKSTFSSGMFTIVNNTV